MWRFLIVVSELLNNIAKVRDFLNVGGDGCPRSVVLEVASVMDSA
jgi:hypothetical protein